MSNEWGFLVGDFVAEKRVWGKRKDLNTKYLGHQTDMGNRKIDEFLVKFLYKGHLTEVGSSLQEKMLSQKAKDFRQFKKSHHRACPKV